jgi:hypothetical protein
MGDLPWARGWEHEPPVSPQVVNMAVGAPGSGVFFHRHDAALNLVRGSPMLLKRLERQVSKSVNSDACPRPATGILRQQAVDVLPSPADGQGGDRGGQGALQRRLVPGDHCQQVRLQPHNFMSALLPFWPRSSLALCPGSPVGARSSSR